jgi:hypothetical protein
MSTRSGLRAAIFCLPVDLSDGVKELAQHRGERGATVVREILREGLLARGVIDGFGSLTRRTVAPPTGRDFE